MGGLSIDFAILNLLGHCKFDVPKAAQRRNGATSPITERSNLPPTASYALYNLAFYLDKGVQKEYLRRHGVVNTVQLNDVAFSVHVRVIYIKRHGNQN